jgi:hypothetical protein
MRKDRIDPIRDRPHAAGDPLRNRSPAWPPRPTVALVAPRVGTFQRDVAHSDVGGANHCRVEHDSSFCSAVALEISSTLVMMEAA